MSAPNPMHDITKLAEAVRKAMLKLPPLPASPPKAYPTNQEKKS